MELSYEQYCENVRRQGKNPMSRQDFEAKKEEVKSNADFYVECAQNGQRTAKSGFWGTVTKILCKLIESGGKEIAKRL